MTPDDSAPIDRRFPSLSDAFDELAGMRTAPPDPRAQIDRLRLLQALRDISPAHCDVITAMSAGKYQPHQILKWLKAERRGPYTRAQVVTILADMRSRKMDID